MVLLTEYPLKNKVIGKRGNRIKSGNAHFEILGAFVSFCLEIVDNIFVGNIKAASHRKKCHQKKNPDHMAIKRVMAESATGSMIPKPVRKML